VAFGAHQLEKLASSQTPPFLASGAVLILARGRIMIDPDSRHGRELKAAEECFALARIAPSPFMRSYYQRVAERYLSSQGELRGVGPNGDHRALSGR
jgi:hypothetical protein